ncbi:hypothetical protein T440DRAFT_405286 [Plenodomus tracheiphilus IPT5]|uniref:Uncharacterized protein n=1 Tax=Plenodomus tracheiphilus IPT5 TaxID=1408161 RepID=A0A6A7AWQ2_9PLEO|nr:hypothetical protein T440DRAFT_405286 [Plenodomus tracheiphilus IPT5]
MAYAPIWIGGRHLEVNIDTLQTLFPGLATNFWANNGDEMALSVSEALNGLTNPRISLHTIEKVLFNMLEAMDSPTFTFTPTSPERRIRKHLEDKLHHENNHHSTHGLRQTRHTYLILCAFAKLTLSQPLAEQMTKFYSNQQWRIQSSEHPHYLNEWALGLRALRELSFDQTNLGANIYNAWPPTPPALPLMLAPHHNPFDTFHQRGRTPLLLAPPRYPRARSLGHRRNHRLQLALPRLANSAWTSPVLSPALRPGNYFDEVGQLQWQQEEMNWKLDGIDQKLDRLVRW